MDTKIADKIIKKAVYSWCENHETLFGIDDWQNGYADGLTCDNLDGKNMFDLVEYIVRRLQRHVGEKPHISFCFCDYEDVENEYDEDDIKDGIPEMERILPDSNHPIREDVDSYDYTSTYIFEIDDEHTPVMPETIRQIALFNVRDLLYEWMDDYLEDNSEEHEQFMEMLADEERTDMDDYDEDGCEYEIDMDNVERYDDVYDLH